MKIAFKHIHRQALTLLLSNAFMESSKRLNDEPQFEIGINYFCGCRERWAVSRLRDDEPTIIVADYKCDPGHCKPCEPYYLANNTAWCNQVGFEQNPSLADLAERAARVRKVRPGSRHYVRDKKA